MRLSQHIGRRVSEGAATDGANTKRIRTSRAARPTGGGFWGAVRSHSAFVPLLTVWGALLLGLVLFVMPDNVIARLSALTGFDISLVVMRAVMSALFAIVGGLLGFIVGSAMRTVPAKPADEAGVVSVIKSRRSRQDDAVRPINPAKDLGSESLDAPIENATLEGWQDVAAVADDREIEEQGRTKSGPTLGELSQRGYEMDAPEQFDDEESDKSGGMAFTRGAFKDALIETCEGATCEPAASVEQERNSRSGRPRELDLAEFGALPGRNGVWLEDPQPEPESKAESKERPEDRPEAKPQNGPTSGTKPTRKASPRPDPMPASALEKLRQTPPEELSLVEMVERFAAALHDHQRSERDNAAFEEPSRDAALAEALKALSLFTQRGFDQGDTSDGGESQINQTERKLRDALARLQDLRGAA